MSEIGNGQEKDIVKQLQEELDVEKHRNMQLQQEIERLKSQQIAHHIEVEQEEEFMMNRLIKNLSNLQKEKDRLLIQLEEEQEFLTNNLQRRLNQVLLEKRDLEQELKEEQDYIRFTLQKRMDVLMAEKDDLHSRIATGGSELIAQLRQCLDKLRAEGTFSNSQEILRVMDGELDKLRTKQEEFEVVQQQYIQRNRQLQDQLKKLESENFVLSQKIERQIELAKQLNQEKARIQFEHETSLERQFHAVQKQEDPSVLLSDLRQRVFSANGPLPQANPRTEAEM